MPRPPRPLPPSAAKILIVDDHPAVREALAIRIASTSDLVVCGEAEDEAQALRLTKVRKPDIVIIDLGLKTGDGISLIKRIKKQHDNVRMLVWSMQSRRRDSAGRWRRESVARRRETSCANSHRS